MSRSQTALLKGRDAALALITNGQRHLITDSKASFLAMSNYENPDLMDDFARGFMDTVDEDADDRATCWCGAPIYSAGCTGSHEAVSA